MVGVTVGGAPARPSRLMLHAVPCPRDVQARCAPLCLQTGHNLVVSAYALGDREAMRRAFLRLLEIPMLLNPEEDSGAGSRYGPAAVSMSQVSGGEGGGAVHRGRTKPRDCVSCLVW